MTTVFHSYLIERVFALLQERSGSSFLACVSTTGCSSLGAFAQTHFSHPTSIVPVTLQEGVVTMMLSWVDGKCLTAV